MKKIISIILVFGLAGCMSAGKHRAAVDADTANSLTVGKVQREIRIGMSSAQVAEILGSPNVVTTDEERREVWVYDKVSSDVTYSQGQGFGTLILLGTDRSSGATSTTQKTLTIIIKFDTEGKVRDFAYHSSKF